MNYMNNQFDQFCIWCLLQPNEHICEVEYPKGFRSTFKPLAVPPKFFKIFCVSIFHPSYNCRQTTNSLQNNVFSIILIILVILSMLIYGNLYKY